MWKQFNLITFRYRFYISIAFSWNLICSNRIVLDDSADKPRSGPLVLEERAPEPIGAITESLSVFNNPYSSLNIQQQRARLPIFKVCLIFELAFSSWREVSSISL